jgi:NAD(P)H-quinone oxidoreductase subunit 5
MMQNFTAAQAAMLLPLLAALVYAAAACWPAGRPESAWRRAQWATAAALLLAALAAAALALGGGGVLRLATLLPLGGFGGLELSVRLDTLTAVMLLLVAFIGEAILRYARRYLDGEPQQPRFVRWYLATLAAVALLVSANNLLLLALAWIATSLALHQLLTFYRDRPQALIAAHKKFIASRVADLCLIGATLLLGAAFGTLEIDQIAARIGTLAALPAGVQAATVLLVGSAALKCAQLPFHGWLIQVMEAPTPVSALLHAGVVNIGGFLMIRLAPLMTASELAQTLLVVCGTVTAAVAALVMTTRVSIKVMLAWSTCAQMGFMLLECGLGAYSLALLHIVGHSLYKAHAFLSAGSTVEQWRAQWQARPLAPVRLAAWLLALPVALLAVAGVAAAFGLQPQREPALWALSVIVSLAMTPLMVRSVAVNWRQFLWLCGGALGVAALYFSWHAVFQRLLLPDAASAAPGLRLAIALAGFAALFLLYALISARPDGRLAQLLHPHLFAGLYLDELFTRLTFKLWPAQLPHRDRWSAKPQPAVFSAPHPTPKGLK